MKLVHLYRIRFIYSEGWGVELEGGWEQFFFLAEGRCEGEVRGRFCGANFPHAGQTRARSFQTSVPLSRLTMARPSCSSRTDTVAPTHPADGRSSAQFYMSVTTSGTDG